MSNTISILIVDDNKELCEILYESINNTGDMRVLATVGDGKAAMDLIRELQPDVVLLDIIMPRLDGLGVLESITSMQGIKRPSIIVITSVGAESVVIRAMELGADYYIMKPFEIGMLITRIRQIYSERKLMTAIWPGCPITGKATVCIQQVPVRYGLIQTMLRV